MAYLNKLPKPLPCDCIHQMIALSCVEINVYLFVNKCCHACCLYSFHVIFSLLGGLGVLQGNWYGCIYAFMSIIKTSAGGFLSYDVG